MKAALLTDQTVFSGDREAQRLLAKAGMEIEELRPIIWIDSEDAFMVDWVQDNALYVRAEDRTLEAFAASL